MPNYKNRLRVVLFPMLLAAGVIGGILFGNYLGRNQSAYRLRGLLQQMAGTQNKLTHTLALIEREYVDSLSIDTLVERVLPVVLKELDPHSVYISAEEMAELNEPLEGEFDGIGVVFNMATDTVIVLNVIPKGPSDKAGVKAGDRIIRINDTIVAGEKIPQNQIVKRLRGPRGTKVRLGLERRPLQGLVDVEVERGVIPIKSIESAFEIAQGIGYIKLGQFSKTSHVELQVALLRFKTQGVKKVIFDLRGNSGGFLDQAILIANEFLHKGQLIVYTEDRTHTRLTEYADGSGMAQDMEVAVLIDEYSASSSEILAGALQDNDRGTIIGRRSFGKGLVQRQIAYPDGSALRLTTARYYTPTGRSIQKPYAYGEEEEYNAELWHRYENNELVSADSIHFADSLKRITPKGKVVYGGGGIMPDLFIPADTTDITPYFMEVSGRNILYRYTIEYADRHREAINKVSTMQELQALLDSDTALFDDFVRYATSHGVKPSRADIARSRRIMEAQLRAYIGRNTALEDNAFYYNIYPIDDVLRRSVDVLREMPMPEPEPEGEMITRELPEMVIKIQK